jgi:hypothetical protein
MPAQPLPTRLINGPSTRTIAVLPGSKSRFSRLKVRYPAATPRPRHRFKSRYPDPPPSPQYDPDLAGELLARTCDLPATRRDLIVVLTEHRRALHALLTQPAPASTAPAAQPWRQTP